MKNKILMLILVLMAVSTANAALDINVGDSVKAGYTSVPLNKIVNITHGTSTMGVYVGMLELKVGEGSNAVLTDGFCIDIADWADKTLRDYTVVDLGVAPDPTIDNMGSEKASKIKSLWAMAYNEISDSTAWSADVAMVTDSATKAAAFQLAIWEIVYDDLSALNLADGSFSINTTQYSLLNSMVEGLLVSLDGYTGPEAELLALTNPSKQDYVVEKTPTPPTVVPAPAAILLVGLGTGLVGHIRRRKEK